MELKRFLLNNAVSFEFDRITFGFKKYNYLYINAIDSKNCRRWVVRTQFNEVWDKELKDFITEPSPSERDAAFLINTRFVKLRDALDVIKMLSDPGVYVWD